MYSKKRPTASQAIQHSFFQCVLPIPELMKGNLKTEVNEEPKNWEESKREEEARKKEIAYNKEKNAGQAEGIGLTSGYYMRNARYKPGVKPLKMKENEIQ